MPSNIIGTYRQQPQGFKAFIPAPFPPSEGFTFGDSLIKKASEATRLVGKLDGITKLLPDLDFFLLMYLRKDAAASSQIEGTKATMIDAIEAEVGTNTNIPNDVDDILHYIKALRYGMKRAKADNFPLSLRFLRELHRELMRGSSAAVPGPQSSSWSSASRSTGRTKYSWATSLSTIRSSRSRSKRPYCSAFWTAARKGARG